MNEEEKTRNEVINYYSTKLNQHVYYIISIIIGFLTYLSRVFNNIDILINIFKIPKFVSISLICMPIFLLIILLLYVIGRFFLWNILLSIAFNFNLNVRYQHAIDMELERSKIYKNFKKKTKDISEDNIYWKFVVLIPMYFEELAVEGKYAPKKSLIWQYAFVFRSPARLVFNALQKDWSRNLLYIIIGICGIFLGTIVRYAFYLATRSIFTI